MMALGFVYFVFLPSIVTTPLAGRAVARFGTRPTLLGRRSRVAGAGLPLLLMRRAWPPCWRAWRWSASARSSRRPTATGFVGRAATTDRGSASGLYLASYFLGGLVGSAVLGQVFDRLGWAACVVGVGVALASPRSSRSAWAVSGASSCSKGNIAKIYGAIASLHFTPRQPRHKIHIIHVHYNKGVASCHRCQKPDVDRAR